MTAAPANPPNQSNQTLYDFAETFFAELAQLGVKDAIVSPGSRSTLLALTSQALDQRVVLDERSAGFVALGLAKTARRPVVLICTSGTAAANYLPAVTEAFHAGVPLLVLTADRPFTSRQWGASQTINQNQLFGQHVGWFAEVAVPAENSVTAARQYARRAMAEAESGAGVPVHLNWPLSKPLEPPDGWWPQPPVATTEASASEDFVFDDDSNHSPAISPGDLAAAQHLADLAQRRGLLIVGSCNFDIQTAQAVVAFAKAANWPVLSEATSGLRFMGAASAETASSEDEETDETSPLPHPVLANGHFLISNYDLLPQTETVVRVGPNPIDAKLKEFLRQHPTDLTLAASGAWSDPEFLSRQHLHGDLRQIFQQATQLIHQQRDQEQPDPRRDSWMDDWLEADRTVQSEFQSSSLPEHQHLRDDSIDQISAVKLVCDSLPSGELLYVASSLALRDVEFFAGTRAAKIRVMANRGANGIDGLVSSAVGAALACRRQVTLLLGDLALLHDLGALVLANQLGVSLRIVVLNNNGGGIFSQLPIADRISDDDFERLFGTPHNLSLDFLDAFPGVKYRQIDRRSELSSALQNDLEASVQIIEVPCQVEAHQRQLAEHRRAARQVLEELSRMRTAAEPSVHLSETSVSTQLPDTPELLTLDLPLPQSLPKLHASLMSVSGSAGAAAKRTPVVLLHGFMGSSTDMRGLTAELYHLYPVLSVDLPGHGRSRLPLEPHNFTIDSTCEMLWGALDAKGIEQAHLVGYSMGGRISLAAAVANPARVKSVTCIGASPGIADPADRADRQQADAETAARLLSHGLSIFLGNWLKLPLFKTLKERMTAAQFSTYRDQRLENDPESLALSLRHAGTGSMEPLHDRLAQADFSCLWVAGAEDQKYRELALEMAQLMPRGSVAVVGEANHAAHLENLPETARTILNFLAAQD